MLTMYITLDFVSVISVQLEMLAGASTFYICISMQILRIICIERDARVCLIRAQPSLTYLFFALGSTRVATHKETDSLLRFITLV